MTFLTGSLCSRPTGQHPKFTTAKSGPDRLQALSFWFGLCLKTLPLQPYFSTFRLALLVWAFCKTCWHVSLLLLGWWDNRPLAVIPHFSCKQQLSVLAMFSLLLVQQELYWIQVLNQDRAHL